MRVHRVGGRLGGQEEEKGRLGESPAPVMRVRRVGGRLGGQEEEKGHLGELQHLL